MLLIKNHSKVNVSPSCISFIEQLAKVSPSSTKHVISQVLAALIPFLEREKEHPSNNLYKVVKILKELVLKNKVVLKEHIREFPPLPSIPALTEVNKKLYKKHVDQ